MTRADKRQGGDRACVGAVRGLDTGPGGGGVRLCVWRGPGGALKWRAVETHLIIQALVVEGDVEGEGG